VPTPTFLRSAARPSDFLPDEGLEVAVVGRSNSGKSAAINCVTGARKLARVSKTPGRTQLINFFEIAPGRRIVDLPGYGFARVPPAVQQTWQSLIESYFDQRKSIAGLMITVDCRRGLMELDQTMLAWAGRLEIPTVVLLTKADKLSRSAALEQQRQVAAKAPTGTECLLFSALSRQGADDAKRRIEAWLEL
jgi:GTP-binding protein